jgi:hypothetical protein
MSLVGLLSSMARTRQVPKRGWKVRSECYMYMCDVYMCILKICHTLSRLAAVGCSMLPVACKHRNAMYYGHLAMHRSHGSGPRVGASSAPLLLFVALRWLLRPAHSGHLYNSCRYFLLPVRFRYVSAPSMQSKQAASPNSVLI